MSLATSSTPQARGDSCISLNVDLLKDAFTEERLERLQEEIKMYHIALRLRYCLASVISSRLSLHQSDEPLSETRYLGAPSNRKGDLSGASSRSLNTSPALFEDVYPFGMVHRLEAGTIFSPICDICSSSSKLAISSIRSTIRFEEDEKALQCECSKSQSGECEIR